MTLHQHRAKRTTDWFELGQVYAPTRWIAIVDPAAGRLLAHREPDSSCQFEEVELIHRGHGGGIGGTSAVMLDTGPEGGLVVVEGRFGPWYADEEDDSDDDEPLRLVEIRIRLADVDNCDDEECAP